MVPRIGMAACPEQALLLVPLLQSLHFQVTVIWCRSFDAAKRIAQNHKIPHCVSHFSDLLLHPEVDMVYVATEPSLQAEVAVKALTSGKHCVCQKPPSVSQSEAEKIVSLSQYYSQLVSVLECHLRFLPAYVKMREMVASGYCGKLLVLEARVAMGSLVNGEPYSWMCEPAMGGGSLNTVGSHLIDVATYVTGQRASQVHACLRTFRPHTGKIQGYRAVASDDFCCFQLQYDGGACACFNVNTHHPGKFEMELSVVGTEGRLIAKGMDLYGCQGEERESLLLEQKGEPLDVGELTHKFPADYYDHLVVGLRGMLVALKEAFGGTSSSSRAPAVGQFGAMATLEDGLYVRTVLDALHESNRAGKWVPVPAVFKSGNVNPFWTSTSQYSSTDKASAVASS